MTAADLLTRARELGIRLWTEGDRLRFDAPEGAMTEELRAAFAAQKSAIVELLAPPVLRRTGEKVLPLSFAQQRLWLLEQLESGSSLYHSYGAVRLIGSVDAAALQKSVEAIVRRHEALRTTFHQRGGNPEQRVADTADVPVQFEDYSGLEPSQGLAAALARANTLRDTPFDLTRGPLLRVALLRVAPDDHLMAVVLHHIVCDGWSVAVFTRELTSHYVEFAAGRAPAVPELKVQYPDYTLWQRAALAGPRLDAQVEFWRKQLEGAPILDLPTDHVRPPRPSGRGAEQSIELPAALGTALDELSRAENATLFMTLMTAFNLLLSRYARQTDIVIGVPVANRTQSQLEPLIGFFVNMLVVRSDVSGNPTFRELLGRVRERTLAALAHQDLPFDLLVAHLQPPRDLTRTPFFGVTFAFQNMPPAVLELPGVRLEPARLDNPTTRFDLELHVMQHDGRLTARLNYSTDLFEPATVREMLNAYRVLLTAVVQQPDASCADLPLVDEATRERLAAWNATSRRYPRDATVHRLFEEVAARRPEARAIVFPDGELTYAQLNARANQLARHLRGLGVGQGTFVGFCLERSTRTIVTMLAILKAGAVYVPLDPEYPADRLRFMVDDVAAPVVVTERRLSSLFAGTPAQLVVVDADSGPPEGAYESGNLDLDGSATDLAYVIYTSGSTGRPKGVCVRHRGVTRLVIGANYVQIEPRDVVAQGSNASFDAATFEVWGALLNGAQLVGLPQEVILAPASLADRLAEASITVLWLTSALFNAVVRERPQAFNGLRAMLVGGEKVDPHSVRRVREHGGPRQLFNGYGPTETTTFAATFEIENLDDTATHVPIGRGISQTRLHVLDDRRLLVPVGMPGELYIGGDGVAAGYWNRPELTAEKFVKVPDIDDGVLYRTGDLVRWSDDGQLEFLGRNDGQVKLRGFRIELGEIEAALRTHAGVADATVMLLDEASDRRLVAYVVPRDGADLVWDGLRAHLRDKLPPYMVPAAFVRMTLLPVNANGKIDRAALPPPDAERPAGEAGYVAPRSAIEAHIAAIWKGVLELDRVGVEDNFFDLGGHSLLLMRVHARLTEFLGREVSIVDLFEFPTIGALASHLSGGRDQALPDESSSTTNAADTGREPIAIIGMAGRFPGADSVDAFWANLRDGVESIRFFDDADLAAAGIAPELIANPRYVRARGVLDNVDLFDADFFGYTPREAEIMDPQHRLFLECAWEALEAAGYDPGRYPGAIGVAAGSNLNSYVGNLIANPELLASVGGVQSLISIASDFLTTRVSYKLDLRGPSVNVQSACSTSLVAVQVACRLLTARDCDIALAGGVSVTVPQVRGHMFVEGGIASPDGHCRTFDTNAQGTVPGNGVGVVVLKRLSAALADGDQIHAVILGAGINNDGGQKVGYTAPGVEGQAEAIARALRDADVDPASVSYIEAHGTATALGDPIEIAALKRAYGTGPENSCALGSLKTNVGHLDAAAGVGGLIKTVLAFKHRQLPPSLHFVRPNRNLGLENSPFYVNAALAEWRSAGPRRAGVSSFGIGGTNAHIVLEEGPDVAPSSASRPWQVLCLSARSPKALARLADRHASYIDAHHDTPLADIAYTLNIGRRALPMRQVVVCASHDDAVRQLRALAAAPPPVASTGAGTRPCVFMFSGQGSQSVDMFRDLYFGEPAFRADVDRCCDELAAAGVSDLRALLFAGGPDERAASAIHRTEFAQPLLFVVEYALARLLMRWGITPTAMIGHSLGEYVAACLAGVLSENDALRVVAVRGRLMQSMEPGAMMSVAAGETRVRDLLPPDVCVAAVNAPESVVVAGPTPAIERLGDDLKGRGISCQRLKTSHAFHSPMMEPALADFARVFKSVTLAAPSIPVISNVTGTWLTSEQATSPEYWVRHLRAPVRFADGLRTLGGETRGILVELGWGEALSVLARMQATASADIVTARPRQATHDAAALLSAVGAVWCAGGSVDWAAMYEGERRLRVSLPTYPFERRRHWVDRPRAENETVPARLPIEEWLLRRTWQRGELPAAAVPRQRWLVLADAAGVSTRLTAALARHGADVVTMTEGEAFARHDGVTFTFNPARPQDYQRAIDALSADDRVPDVVAHCLGVTDDADPSRGWDRGFYSLLWLEQAFGRAGIRQPRRLAVLTSRAVAVADDDPVLPFNAASLAPAAVSPAEHPHVTSCIVDLVASEWLGADDESIDRLLTHLASEIEPLIALRGGHVMRPAVEPIAAESNARPRLRDGGVYVVTGAFGGIGRALSSHLVRRHRARLLLIARTPLPGRDSWRAFLDAHDDSNPIAAAIRHVEELESIGGEVLVAAADVADEAAMQAAIESAVARWGAIHGIIHSAGVAGGGVMQLKTRDAAASVLAPKVAGTEVLARLIDPASLDFVVLCSSLASVLGGAGQVDYCAANAYLDAFAHEYTRRTGVFTVSINWDTWRDAGMAVNTALPSQLETRREAALRRGIGADEGAEIFERVLSLPAASQVLVSTLLWQSRIARPGTASESRAPKAVPHAIESAASAAVSADEIARTITSVWQQLLGIDAISRTDNFFELGGHSLLLLQAQTALSRQLQREVPIATLFQYPTIAALADHLGSGGAAAAVAPAPVLRSESNAIAIVGLAARLPGAPDVEQLWANIRQRVESIEFCSDDELKGLGIPDDVLSRPDFVRAVSAIDGIDLFDAALFNYTPREAELLDPQQRVFLELTWQALEHAGCDPARYQGRIGVFAGASTNSYYQNIASNPDVLRSAGSFQAAMGSKSDFLPARVSYKLNLRGPSVNVQTACSTSLVAVHQACRSLTDGDCEMAVAGGVSIGIPVKSGYFYHAEGILSPDGHCRPFDAEARGTVPASGAGVVVLMRLDEALAAGHTVHGVIRGTAINNDGAAKVGFTAPSVSGQAAVITRAQAAAGIAPDDVSYVEAHGTGTALGDPIEIAALNLAFGPGEPGSCAIGTLKSNLGHLDTAAGVAGLIKTVMALKNRELPPSLHFETANPQIDFANSRFFVNTSTREWPARTAGRIAGVSSFGIGGTNAHVIVEEAPAIDPPGPSRDWQLLVVSGKNEAALEGNRTRLAAYLADAPAPLADVAHTLQVGRTALPHRLVVVCRDAADAVIALSDSHRHRHIAGVAPESEPSCVLMFSGQGTQHPGMARELYAHDPDFRADVDACADLAGAATGEDFRDAAFSGRDDEAAATRLKQTAVAQSALFAIEYAMARQWLRWGIRPAALIGHSLGEYVAACIGGVFSLEDAVSLVVARGRAMQRMPAGAMLAVPLPERDLAAMLPSSVSVAAVNAASSCVVSGPVELIEQLGRDLHQRGIECRRLETSHAFHSSMMDAALEEFRAAVEKTVRHSPTVAIVSNVTGAWLTADEATSVDYWVGHMRRPVRFAEGVRTLASLPAPIYVEVGPGRTLASFVGQIDNQARTVTSLPHPQQSRSAVEHVIEAAAELWVAGVAIDWFAYGSRERRRLVPLPTYAFQRQRYWVERSAAHTPLPQPQMLSKSADIDTWCYVPVWQRAAPPVAHPLPAGEVCLVFADQQGVGDEVAQRLANAGCSVVRVEAGSRFAHRSGGSYTIDAASPGDYDALLDALQTDDALPRRIAHLWSLDASEDDYDFERAKALTFYSVLFLTQALLRRGLDTIDLAVVGSGWAAVQRDDDIQPAMTPLPALCTVIGQEHPGIRTAAIDVVVTPITVTRVADQIVRELQSEFAGVPAAYRGPQRWLEGYQQITTAAVWSGAFRTRGVYVITGGLGSVGLALACHLARQYSARLVLIGRNLPPPRREWDAWLRAHGRDDRTSKQILALQEMEAAGAEVQLHAADVADAPRLRAVFAAVADWFGRIDGVIHAAGQTTGAGIGPVAALDRDGCEAQFRSKIDGLHSLAEAVADLQPGFCALTSSLSSILGGLGFGAYAAANRYMDAFAEAANRRNSRWLSIASDAWAFTESRSALADLAMTAAEGVHAIERVIESAPSPRVAISTASLDARLDRYVRRAPAREEVRPAALTTYARPTGIDFEPPADDAERLLAEVWQEMIGVDRVGRDDDFFKLGGHSLLATRVIAHVKQRCGVELALKAFFERPRLKELAERVSELRWVAQSREVGVGVGDREEIEI